MTPPRKHPETGPMRSVWQAMNRLIDYTESLRIAPSPTVHPKQTAQGTTLVVRPGKPAEPPSGGTIRRYRIEQNQNDYWVCSSVITADGVDFVTGTLVNVAKPWRLRRTPFHNKTISFTDEQGRNYDVSYDYLSASRRRVTINGVLTEFQVVVPRAKPEFDYIFAMAVDSESGTGVSITTPQPPPAQPIVTPVTLIDVNADGRAWARER